MLSIPKSKQVGYQALVDSSTKQVVKTACEQAKEACARLGKGSVKEGTTGTWYHEIPFDLSVPELGKLNEDTVAIAAKYGKTEEEILTAYRNGLYLLVRNLIEDGKDPIKSATAKRDTVFEEITDWTIETGNKTYREQIKAAKAVSVKTYNEWMDDFIASKEYTDGSWKTI